MDRPLTHSAATLTNSSRLWSSIMRIAEIGAIEGNGSCRLSLTDEDKEARDLFRFWVTAAGCEVRVDNFGNIYAIRPGARDDLPAVLIGSHLDTQPHGGRFDGVLGVMAGLEIVRALNDAGIETEAPIAIVNWTNEEGVRFKPGLTGSCGFVGALPGGDESSISSSDGSRYYAELARIGYAGQDRPPQISTYFEMHIEQGPVLENAGATIGIVEGVQGVRWFEIDFLGQDSHAGTTPMNNRRDSFLAASRYALGFLERAMDIDPDVRVTFGRVEVEPNSTNTIPGRTRLVLDLRHIDEHVLDRVERLMADQGEPLKKLGFGFSINRIMNVRPALFNRDLKDAVEKVASSLSMPSLRLPSGAMHDASNLAAVVPSAMIFIPSRNGISHNPLEWSEPMHVGDGCELLCRAVLEAAKA
ncbi:M20 family metallo-hydrolase [Rhizobium mesoamericanum]|uniref:M20 family metallo-hydrolase n=1 Tax=Rhizobium mesoamericanum TaxID=1079800 RepID=UPI0027D83264|nr:M20 family metallo-hydrolase [Rhizobium mesoamericanum]